MIMPIYYFDVRAGSNLITDEDGAEFSGVDAAEEEARIAVLQIAQHRLAEGSDCVSVDVRDENGDVVIAATASIAVSRADR